MCRRSLPAQKKINKLVYGLGFTFGLGGNVAVVTLIAFMWKTRNKRQARAPDLSRKKTTANKFGEGKRWVERVRV